MTTRSIKGNVLRFAAKRRNDEKLVHSKSDLNTSFLLPPVIGAFGTHTGQRPSPIVWRAVRRALRPVRTKEMAHRISFDEH